MSNFHYTTNSILKNYKISAIFYLAICIFFKNISSFEREVFFIESWFIATFQTMQIVEQEVSA